jgi:uncharacterized membrane protein
MRKILLLIILIIILDTVSAAQIHGSIFDISLNLVENTVLEVNSKPRQYFVAKNGTYSFNLPKGEYTILAEYQKDDTVQASASENISIIDNGDYILDFILFPSFEDENELLNEDLTVPSEEPEKKEASFYPILLIIIIILVLSIVAVIIYLKKKPTITHASSEQETDLNQIVDILKSHGGRATQKDIRKQLPLSEAKISLMITELEHKGIIKKIKKGRGNILILEK